MKAKCKNDKKTIKLDAFFIDNEGSRIDIFNHGKITGRDLGLMIIDENLAVKHKEESK